MLDDRQIREMLQNAEEKAPRRIWDSVSSQLDAIDGRRTVAPVWKWAGAAVAVAAALVAGVFISGVGDKSQDIVSSPVLAEASVEVVCEENGAEPLNVGKPDPVRILPARKNAGPLLAEAVPASAPESETELSEEGNIVETYAEPEVRKEVDEELSAGDGAALDRMEEADSRIRSVRRMDLVVNGTLSGNTASKAFRSSMSGGIEAIPSSDIIKETGASDFGVPFTVGVGFRYYLTPKFSIGSGLDYSLLTRTFAGTYTAASTITSVAGDIRNTMHYLGIPVNLYYDIISSPSFGFYVYGGGEGEYCISNRYDFHSGGAVPGNVVVRQKVNGLQFSAKIGVGVQFRLSDRVGLYLDPGVCYYFYGGQPRSIRTERPLMFNLNAGLRFDLRKN